jgi:hypothetical protein
MPARKLLGPKPSKGESQLSLSSRFLRKASTVGDFGATIPHPKIPTRVAAFRAGAVGAEELAISGILQESI